MFNCLDGQYDKFCPKLISCSLYLATFPSYSLSNPMIVLIRYLSFSSLLEEKEAGYKSALKVQKRLYLTIDAKVEKTRKIQTDWFVWWRCPNHAFCGFLWKVFTGFCCHVLLVLFFKSPDPWQKWDDVLSLVSKLLSLVIGFDFLCRQEWQVFTLIFFFFHSFVNLQ